MKKIKSTLKKNPFPAYDDNSNANFENLLKQKITNLAICYFFKLSKTYFYAFEKWNQTKSRYLLKWCICCLISSFKKGGKIQTGLNCGDDSLSKVWLWLAYSSTKILALVLKTSQKDQYVMVLVFRGGSLVLKFNFY